MTHIDPALLKPRDLTAFKRATSPQPQITNLAKRIIPARQEAVTKSIVISNDAERKRAMDQIAAMRRIEEARAAMGQASRFRSNTAVKVHDIAATVAAYFGISVIDIESYRRDAVTVRARQIVYYLSKELTRRSYPDIGRQIGRDHTTILYGSRKISRLIETDMALASDIEALRFIINPKLQEAAE